MIILLIALFVICLFGMKFSKFHNDYMSHSQTGAIKGIFTMIIFLSHIRGYISLSTSALDTTYNAVLNYIGQLMVALFLFYSGYGIMESYKRKNDYVNGFIRKRVGKTLIHFDIAVLCFVILSLFTKSGYGWKEYVFCWIGWTSVGNSNWFIFIILLLYGLTFFAFVLCGKLFSNQKQIAVAICISVGSAIAWLGLHFIGKETYWYDTLLCYPCGVLFSLFKEKIERVCKTTWLHYATIFGTFFLFIVLYIIYYKVALGRVVSYSICACVFCIAVVLITTKIKVDNCVLRWLGKYSFSIYILQRLPMIVLTELDWDINKWVFTALALAVTLLLAIGFEKIYTLVDKVCIHKKEKTVSEVEKRD